MRKFKVLTALILSLCLLLICGCGTTSDPSKPQYLEKVEEMLGKDLTQAVKKLGIRADALTNPTSLMDHKLPDTIRYQEQDFEVFLYGVGENTDIQSQSLMGIGYRAVISGEPEKAIQTANAILDTLCNAYADPFRVEGTYEPPYITDEFTDAVQKDTEWDGSEKWTISTDVQNISFAHPLGEQILKETDRPYRYTVTLDLSVSEGTAVILLRYRLDFFWKN